MNAGRYRKKPVVIDAVQLCWRNWSAVCELMAGNDLRPPSDRIHARESEEFSDTCGESAPFIELPIVTLEGTMLAKHGDWIIRGVNGEFYPCKPDIFETTYEPEVTYGTE